MWKNVPFTIVMYHQVAKFLDQLAKAQPSDYQHIDHVLYALALFKAHPKTKALTGEFKGLLSTRVRRKYRIIFQFDYAEGKLYVLEIDHRKNVYRP